MQNRDVMFEAFRVVCLIGPGISHRRFRVTREVKYLKDSFSNRLAFDYLLYGRTLTMRSFRTEQATHCQPAHGLR
jgi:hypothetical protein